MVDQQDVSDTVKITVNVPREEAEYLKAIAEETRTSMTFALRDAIRTQKQLRDGARRGADPIIREPDGRTSPVNGLFRWVP